jgi:hypothetical protein
MNVLKTINEIEAALCWTRTEPEPVVVKTQPTGIEQKMQILKHLQDGPALAVEIAVKMMVRPKTINGYARQLERLGCIRFEKAWWNYKQLHFITYDNYDKEPPTYEKRKRKIKQEALPELPFDPFLSRMMGYTDIPVPQADVHMLLNRPCPVTPLRKMNYAWKGYQSGLEAA